MKRVAITGISGYLGTQILKLLDQDKDVESVVGIDIRPPSYATSKLKFYSRDVREPLIDIFAQNKVDSAFHLAFVLPPNFRVDAHDINIRGSQSFLSACEATSVEALFYQSSHTVYGPHPDNPPLITEDQPLRPVPAFPYGQDKAEVDLMFQEYMRNHPKQSVTIVRVVSVVGPHAGVSGLNVLFMPVTIHVCGYNPGWQFIFEDDLARLDMTLVKERRSGIFNAGAEGALPYRDMLRATGKPSLGLPSWLWKFLISFSWATRIQRKSPAGGLEYMKYPIILSTEKLAKTTNFKFTMNSQEALKSYMDAKMAGAKAAKAATARTAS
ncbi:MAG: NAD-dependent epimerase/dehydratase family protein [Dehalococcoidia bacterium]|nr:NAD-dependent epimerase/dehydratase family protein [Dehalococcoidia bacterium]